MPPVAARHLKIAEEFWVNHYADKTRPVPLAVVRERLLQTRDADSLPNALVAKLLVEADHNQDGYLNYEEYMSFVSVGLACWMTGWMAGWSVECLVIWQTDSYSKVFYFDFFSVCFLITYHQNLIFLLGLLVFFLSSLSLFNPSFSSSSSCSCFLLPNLLLFIAQAEASARESRARLAFNRAALSVVPRGERTAEKRSYLQQYRCCPPALFMVTAALAEVRKACNLLFCTRNFLYGRLCESVRMLLLSFFLLLF